MRAFTAITLALAGSSIAAPMMEERDTSSRFRLSVIGSENLNGWAVLEAHVAAGTNAIEIQRPSVSQTERHVSRRPSATFLVLLLSLRNLLTLLPINLGVSE